jgi:thiamine-phosphate pyrophosphorylase
MLISDAGRVGMSRFLEVLAEAWSAGLLLLQVREPDMEEALDRILSLERPSGARILINRRADLCAPYSLDGVHVGGGRPERVKVARGIVGERLVGYSGHREDEVFEAARYGADYVTYSPVFGALSKEHPLPALGEDALRRMCALSPVPVVALGAVTPERARAVRRAGAAGMAVIGSIVDAERPGEVVREFLRAWESAG